MSPAARPHSGELPYCCQVLPSATSAGQVLAASAPTKPARGKGLTCAGNCRAQPAGRPGAASPGGGWVEGDGIQMARRAAGPLQPPPPPRVDRAHCLQKCAALTAAQPGRGRTCSP